MARTETPKKRVSNLVGRFEQLAQSSPVQEYIFQSPVSPTSPRPPSQYTERGWLQHDRRSLSLSSKPTVLSLSAKLERELDRNAKLRQEIEDLRDRRTEGDDILKTLLKRLEVGTEMQVSSHMQTPGLQTKENELADNLSHRDKIQKAEYERRVMAIVDERDMLASKLRMADASFERARALEDAVRSADEKARIAEEKARVASDQIATLRSQLMGLKADVATRSRKDVDVSDQEILDMMNKLNHLVQNWCVGSFRKVKIGTYPGDAQLQ
jgi:chromosome segregation ATPase